MMNIYPQTLDIQDGTPDLKIALIIEIMEKNRNDMTAYIKCEYCGCKIRTKGRFNHFETDKCKRIKEQKTLEIIDKISTLPDNVFGKIWEMIQ